MKVKQLANSKVTAEELLSVVGNSYRTLLEHRNGDGFMIFTECQELLAGLAYLDNHFERQQQPQMRLTVKKLTDAVEGIQKRAARIQANSRKLRQHVENKLIPHLEGQVREGE